MRSRRLIWREETEERKKKKKGNWRQNIDNLGKKMKRKGVMRKCPNGTCLLYAISFRPLQKMELTVILFEINNYKS